MGVWRVGPKSRAFSLKHLNAQEHPEARPSDVLGSPYAIAGYQVGPELGGNSALAQFRLKLASFGVKLMLDFVPNHVGLDHPWLTEKPELFVQAKARTPGCFLHKARLSQHRFAHGRDPYFSPWQDTVQLDYRVPATHQAMLSDLQSIVARCDALRCDMAMLVLNQVFQKTWAHLPCPTAEPVGEFWSEAIPLVKKQNPNFMFLAEAYWGLESRLHDLGFDFTYDKTLYDDLVARRALELQRHLLHASRGYLNASAHFLENHDEARIASLLSFEEQKTAALLLLSLPGLRLLHEGQLSGATDRASIHLCSRSAEPPQPQVVSLYEQLLQAVQTTAVAKGNWHILEPEQAWPSNPTAQNVILLQWQSQPAEFDLVVLNFAPHPSQCYARLQLTDLATHTWHVQDRVSSENYVREGAQIQEQGLYLDLPAHAGKLFHFRRV